MKKITFYITLILLNFPAFGIDPTPGTGTYDPGISCPNGCTNSESLRFPAELIKPNVPTLIDYLTDNCDKTINSHFGNGTCEDGSVSFNQPPSEGYWEQEGMCGQVGISNLYNNYCSWNIQVDDVDEYYAWDFTPGTRTGILVEGVNKLFSKNSDCPNGKFLDKYAKNERDYISSVLSATHQTVGVNQLVRTNNRGQKVKRAPVMTLINLPGKKILHWVMVVDVEFIQGQCNFIVNSWGSQMTVPCSTMAEWSRNVDRKFPLLPGSYKYSIIEFNK